MNSNFHTPSSTSCIISGNSILNILKPEGDNLSENVFWKYYKQVSQENKKQNWVTYRGRNQRLVLQHGSTVYLIASFIDSPCCVNLAATADVIHMGKSLLLINVPQHTQVWSTAEWNK